MDAEDCLGEPFEILEPARHILPLVCNSPHSGRRYPPEFLNASRLDQLALRRSEDCYVDLLFADAVRLGAPLMRAHFPRAFLDVNREPFELDPRMFEGRLPGYANTRSMRVAGGLGTIARVVGDGQDIYRGRLSVAEGLRRIERFYKPYHHALRNRLDAAVRQFGEIALIDCHSMPSASLGQEATPRPDIVLGDRYGTSAAPDITEVAETIFRALGFHVARNRPYAGGFITEHYGAPAAGVHALQIEINRALYMHEMRLELTDGFEPLRAALAAFVARFAASGVLSHRPNGLPLAAE
jgi:N-formylglutamate amidohydrolase